MTRDFLTKCLNNFQDQKASPELKFYTLSVIYIIITIYLDFKKLRQ